MSLNRVVFIENSNNTMVKRTIFWPMYLLVKGAVVNPNMVGKEYLPSYFLKADGGFVRELTVEEKKKRLEHLRESGLDEDFDTLEKRCIITLGIITIFLILLTFGVYR